MRYDSKRGNRRIGVSDSRNGRVQGVLLAVVSLVLVGTLVISIPGIRFRSETDNYMKSRMLTECDGAMQRVTRLSRNASSTSAQTVAEIRSYIYAIDTLNQARNALMGKQTVSTAQLSRIYDLLESYANQLIQGSDTGALQSSISSEIQTLYETLQAVQ